MRAIGEGIRIFSASLVLSAVLGASFPTLPHLWLWSIIIVGVLTLVTYSIGDCFRRISCARGSQGGPENSLSFVRGMSEVP